MDLGQVEVARVFEFGQARGEGFGRWAITPLRTFKIQSLVRALLVVVLAEGIQLTLLLRQVGCRRLAQRTLERAMHALMSSVLLRLPRRDAFRTNAKANPPDRQA